MKRFFVQQISGDTVVLSGAEHRHLSQVLRLRPDERVVVCDGSGRDYHCTIMQIDRHDSTLRIDSSQPNLCEPTIQLTLYQALPKSDKIELIIQKCVELGVSHIVPFVSRFCTARSLNSQRADRIVLEASKQCGRARLVDVSPVCTVEQVCAQLGQFDAVIFADECATQPDLGTVLPALDAHRVAVIIGSEGGFAPEEAQSLRAAGASAVTLGHRILRCETAAIVVVGAVMLALGQLAK